VAVTERDDLDVLVVDDDPSLTALLADHLAAAGHRVRTAADGHEALVAIGEARPDVIVLDVRMPVLDGWGVLEALSEEPTTAALPVVVLTGSASEEDLIRAHLSGAVAYLNKPFEIATLLEAVTRAVAPLTPEQRQRRRTQLRGLVGRLAALDAGRDAGGPRVRFSRLEPVPRPAPTTPLPSAERLTSRQRLLAGLLADGIPPRTIAERLGTSRSNVYATRARIAEHLGVGPEQVADTARRIGLTAREGGATGTDDPERGR
jgi:CheY-like chemotaxis protein/DNA-binding CsgD family transcriptional regulator